MFKKLDPLTSYTGDQLSFSSFATYGSTGLSFKKKYKKIPRGVQLRRKSALDTVADCAEKGLGLFAYVALGGQFRRALSQLSR